MFVYAVKDLKQGQEVTLSNINSFASYDMRTQGLAHPKHIVCQCRLCLLDRSDPLYEQREFLHMYCHASAKFVSRVVGIPSEDPSKLSVLVSKLVIDKDLDKTEDERLDMLHQYFIEAKEDGTILDGKAIANEAERLELKTKAPFLLAQVLFDTDMINQIKLHRGLFLRFCLDDKKAQRYLLGGIELKIFENKKVLLPKTAHIVKALYDLDLCNEETILSWGSKPKSKHVTKDFMKELIKTASPVIKWLQEAEEEEDSDIDESVKYEEGKKSIYEKKPNDSEDDINIDEI